MPMFRKKTIEIEAHQWFQNGDHPNDGSRLGKLTEGLVVRRYRHPDQSKSGGIRCDCGYILHDHGWIDTLEGGHTVCPGDWIITGIKGEQYPCKPDIFEMTYDKI